MEPEEYLRTVRERLGQSGYSVSTETLGGSEVLIGYRSQFRLAWFATKLHLFVVIGSTSSVAADELSSFTAEVLRYGIRRTGRLRGLQMAVAVVPVLAAPVVQADAVSFAESQPQTKFAAQAWPVVVDLAGRQLVRPTSIRFGRVYADWILRQVQLLQP